MPLFWRIFIMMLLVVVVFSAALTAVVSTLVREQNVQIGIEKLKDQAKLIAQYYYNQSLGFPFANVLMNQTIENTLAINNAPVWVYNLMGGFIYDPPGATYSPTLSTEIAQSLVFQVIDEGKTVFPNAFDRVLGVESVSVGEPLKSANGTLEGAVVVNAPLADLQGSLKTFIARVISVAAFVLLIGMALAAWVARRVTQPMVSISKTAHAFAQGDFTQRVDIRGNDEVGKLALSFNEMADDLANLEDMRRTFVANVSHELRSPLTSIHGYVGGMLDGTIPESEYLRYLGVVDDETQRLISLVRDLLDLSRIESNTNQLSLNNLNVNEMIRRVIIRLEGRLEDRQIRLDMTFRSDELMVLADAARIEQVLYNLLDNAVKFSHHGGSIVIATHAKPPKAYIMISDEGQGIHPDDLPFVFDRFYKGDKSHSGGGTGLGLSIVRGIIESHGEEIKVQSTLGKGTTFVFTLQLA